MTGATGWPCGPAAALVTNVAEISLPQLQHFNQLEILTTSSPNDEDEINILLLSAQACGVIKRWSRLCNIDRRRWERNSDDNSVDLPICQLLKASWPPGGVKDHTSCAKHLLHLVGKTW